MRFEKNIAMLAFGWILIIFIAPLIVKITATDKDLNQFPLISSFIGKYVDSKNITNDLVDLGEFVKMEPTTTSWLEPSGSIIYTTKGIYPVYGNVVGNYRDPVIGRGLKSKNLTNYICVSDNCYEYKK